MIAEQLKKSILQAAIQGKLTQQLPEDGDARDLLKDIQKEKARLIKEGKIKKEKPLPEITEDEIPFEIPENWCWVRFGVIFSIGSASRVHQKDWRPSGIPFYRAREIAKLSEQGYVDNELFIDNDFYEKLKSESGVPKIGDLMVTGVGTLGKTYIVKETDQFYYKDASVLCVTNLGNINPNFFKYFMESQFMMDQINSNSSGTTVSTLTISRFGEYLFSLPPLSEQERVVEQLNDLLLKINKLKNDEIKLEELQKSFPKKMKDAILQYAIQGKLTQQLPEDGDARDLLKDIQKEKVRLIKEGKIKKEKPLPEITEDEIPFEIPENWFWVRLGELSALITDGTHKTPDYQTKGISFLSVQNISSGEFDLSKIKYISEREHSLLTQRCKPEYGDILFCRIGTLGKPIINTLNFDFSIFVSLALIKLVNMDCNRYLVKYLSSPSMEQWIEINKVGGGTHTNKINLRDLHMVPIPFSPIAEQKRIVKKIEDLLLLCKKLE